MAQSLSGGKLLDSLDLMISAAWIVGAAIVVAAAAAVAMSLAGIGAIAQA
jgi:hypothetical protein